MQKFRTILLLLVVAFVVSLIAPGSSEAALPAELENQIKQTQAERNALLEEQKRLEAELREINAQSQTLGTAVSSLDAARRKLANDISITQSKISSANLNIRALENSMSEKEYQIYTHRSAIGEVIRQLVEHDSRSILVDLALSDGLSEVWEDRATLSDLSGRLETEIAILRDTRAALDREREAREETRAELEDLKGDLSGQKVVVERNKADKARLLAETKNKEAEYQRLIQLNIERQKESEADLARLETELQIALDPSLFPSARHSILAWPLDYVYITQQFGHTAGGKRLYASGFHNGVDFRAPMGTQVRAVADGVVRGAGNTDDQQGCYSYGRWILLEHPNGLSTIYAHLSGSLVRQGQGVKAGQVIAYSGGTPGTNGAGYSTGPHLHIGLFASQAVEVKQFVTSRGCKQVWVPIAKGVDAYLDPLAYFPSL